MFPDGHQPHRRDRGPAASPGDQRGHRRGERPRGAASSTTPVGNAAAPGCRKPFSRGGSHSTARLKNWGGGPHFLTAAWRSRGAGATPVEVVVRVGTDGRQSIHLPARRIEQAGSRGAHAGWKTGGGDPHFLTAGADPVALYSWRTGPCHRDCLPPKPQGRQSAFSQTRRKKPGAATHIFPPAGSGPAVHAGAPRPPRGGRVGPTRRRRLHAVTFSGAGNLPVDRHVSRPAAGDGWTSGRTSPAPASGHVLRRRKPAS